MVKKKARKTSGLPASVKKQADEMELTAPQARFMKMCTDTVKQIEGLDGSVLDVYWDIGRRARAVYEGTTPLHNLEHQPATLKDMANYTCYNGSMLSKLCRFATRFDDETFKRMRAARWESIHGHEIGFNWSHIDALLSLGPGSGETVSALVDKTIAEGLTAVSLKEEVKKLQPENKRPGSGRPRVPGITFTRITARTTNLLDDFEDLRECLPKHFEDDDRDDSKLREMAEKLELLRDESESALGEIKAELSGK